MKKFFILFLTLIIAIALVIKFSSSSLKPIDISAPNNGLSQLSDEQRKRFFTVYRENLDGELSELLDRNEIAWWHWEAILEKPEGILEVKLTGKQKKFVIEAQNKAIQSTIDLLLKEGTINSKISDGLFK